MSPIELKPPSGRFARDWSKRVRVLSVAVLFILFCQAPASAADTIIYVRLLVDDNEVTRPGVWQSRLKKRVDNASDIISKYASVRFKVKAFGTWNSDNRLRDLNRSLREFEQEVSPKPGQIAIGFSSQYKFQKGRNALGGTRGPLHSHVLLRESAPNIFEAEKLEALVHELGHFLGAAHSSDPNSAMRPVVGDGRARHQSFRIGFDPVNAKIMRLIANEMKSRRVRNYRLLSDRTKQRITAEYLVLAKQLPSDPAAKRFIELMKAPRPSAPNVGRPRPTLLEQGRAGQILPHRGRPKQPSALRKTQ